MVITTGRGVWVAYDGTSDVTIVTTGNGVDVAWEPVASGVILSAWYYKVLLSGVSLVFLMACIILEIL